MAMTETVAAAAEQAAESNGGRFWCHECNAQVPTSLDEASAEVCCNNCGGNFVEEIDEVNDAQTARKIGVGYAVVLMRSVCARTGLLGGSASGWRECRRSSGSSGDCGPHDYECDVARGSRTMEAP